MFVKDLSKLSEKAKKRLAEKQAERDRVNARDKAIGIGLLEKYVRTPGLPNIKWPRRRFAHKGQITRLQKSVPQESPVARAMVAFLKGQN